MEATVRQLEQRTLQPKDLKVGDVVCFAHRRFPFGDHCVTREDDQGFYLRRAYIDFDGKPAYEEGYWLKNSQFEFWLLERHP